ncbi:hypothetical protein [Flavivirga aquatica]|uniref:hypothetical protein n=1 Tax=Flavivirga aquatica TaxID=1849968 RepID=UPI000F4EDB01|nr:hypothetical protein [Flavivirga aquatica]
MLSSLNLFGDAGNDYRFYLELISKNSDTISGYFYHYPYNEYDKFTHYDQNFKNFIKKDSIALYSFISTVNIGNMNIDFSKTDFKKTIDLNKYDHIRVIDYLDFGGGVYRIKELNKN